MCPRSAGGARSSWPRSNIPARDVCNSAGEQVPFSADAARAFLARLPDWIVGGIMDYFTTNSNFTDADEEADGSGPLDPAQARAAAGNL